MTAPPRPAYRLFALGSGAAVLAVGVFAASAGVVRNDSGAIAAYRAFYSATHPLAPQAAAASDAADPAPVPKAKCGPGSIPETGRQGRAPTADYYNGRAAKGYLCNAVQVSKTGTTGGWKTFHYTDRTGRVCAFYDGSVVPPATPQRGEVGGVHVLDMTDPARPVETARLLTPAMVFPHESLALNARRGLLAAGMGFPLTNAGIVDIYDVSQDCRNPVLQSSTPMGLLGHESGFSPDGRTLWISSGGVPHVTAIDVSNPHLPSIVWASASLPFHGMRLSNDGNRLYGANTGITGGNNADKGLTIMDVSQVQRRDANPVVTQVSHLTWPTVSVPQNSIPVTIKGRKYLVEFDEFDLDGYLGAVRMIDITNDKKPRVVSDLRLEVYTRAARASEQGNDPGQPIQGYAAHYCAVPREVEPGIVACSMIGSGLRVFDIRDPLHPREVAYFNKPAPIPLDVNSGLPYTSGPSYISGSQAMSAPSFDLARHEVSFVDANSGFYVVKLTNGAWLTTP